MRFNHLHPPFDNAAARRAVLGVIDQAEFMTAATEDLSPWRDRVGVFTPGTPMANEAGIEGAHRSARRGPREGGTRGRRLPRRTCGRAAARGSARGVVKHAGRRRCAEADPHDVSGYGCMDPSSHIALRGNGRQAWAGWPTSPRIEELRTAWFDAPDWIHRHRAAGT